MKTLITPAKATELLAGNAENQRKVNQARVRKYTAEMLSGLWLYNGESIIVSESGKLIDGQHRLLAVIESDVTIEVALVTDVPDEQDGIDTFLTINTENRSNADALYISGFKVENANIARLLSLLSTFSKQRLREKPSGIKYLNPEIVTMAREFGEESALEIIERAKNLQSRNSIVSLNYWLVIVHVMRQLPGGVQFTEDLADGNEFAEGAPVGALVAFFNRYDGKGGGAAIARAKWIAIFKAYKAYVQNTQVINLRVTGGMPLDYPAGIEYEEA